jgi:N-acetylneuraminic acid mutarotase
VADDEYMYVIGGGTPNPGDSPVDVFTYHFATNTWERRMCRSAMADGALPIARRSHTCILYNKKIYMFGGTDGHTMYFDFWCLDLEAFTWQPIRLHPDAAGAKCFHAAAVTPQV